MNKIFNDYLLGIYKEPGKTPTVLKVENKKEYLQELVGGEIATLDYEDYTIIYKKDSNNLLANIYIAEYLKIGFSLKGKIFAVGKDKKGNFISLNKEQTKKCISFFLRESFNYKGFDEQGFLLSAFKNKNQKFPKNKYHQQERISDQKKKISQNNLTSSDIKLSNEDTLNMLLKITFIILGFLKGALDDSNDDK